MTTEMYHSHNAVNSYVVGECACLGNFAYQNPWNQSDSKKNETNSSGLI
jgi:hypothetical protein